MVRFGLLLPISQKLSTFGDGVFAMYCKTGYLQSAAFAAISSLHIPDELLAQSALLNDTFRIEIDEPFGID